MTLIGRDTVLCVRDDVGLCTRTGRSGSAPSLLSSSSKSGSLLVCGEYSSVKKSLQVSSLLPLPPFLFSVAPFVYAGVTVCQQVVNTVCKRL